MKTIAVTSGKGGVGKTNLSANLGIQLALRGHRTLIFDADIGLANLDVVLGTPSDLKLQHVISREKSLLEVVQAGPGGVKFIAGGSGAEALVTLDGQSGEQFLADLHSVESMFDYLIIDTGAGIDENVMLFLCASDEVLLVATPDPASLSDAYATLKALIVRKPSAEISVVMNMVDDESQGRTVFAKLTSICQQFLGRSLKYAGCIRLDTEAIQLIRQRQPYSLANPDLRASQDVARLASSVTGEAHIHTTAETISLADRLRKLFGWGLQKTA